ncbi:unnamed protein product [Effrenium voratum]|uniref:Uncharacterized protein n=1 Tax=Effrenium voratum TaxID=2562239 RepID=A0AA36J888_9DINO|nr:unnamed protein product [Effrenium voratum]CAJ1458148.1 unnamed protein product [Effrenium voratum]
MPLAARAVPPNCRRWSKRPFVALQVVCLACFALKMWHLGDSSSRRSLISRWPNWPYVVAATFFGAQCLFASVISFSILPILHHRDQGGDELLRRMREVSFIMTFVSFTCCGYYLNLSLEDSGHKLVSQTNWLTGAEELRLLGRYWLWAVLAPMQWVSFARLYTTASAGEILSLVITTALVMLLGLASATSRVETDDQVAWRYEGKCYFGAASVLFVLMFWQVFVLPLDPSSATMARKYLRFAALLWVAYPVAHVLRSVGIFSLWQEQIFTYTLLDVAAKGVALMICFCGPIFRIFLSSLGNHQIQSAMVDWKISVTDPGWEVKKPSTDALAAMQSHWLGGDAVGKNFLDWVLDSEESRQAVRAAALALDIESSFSTHKVAVVLRLRGEQVQALLFVSRAFWGSRQLAIALLQGVETAQPSVPVQVPRQLVERSRAPTITVEEASERGTVRTGVSSIGSAIPLFRTDRRP